MDYVSGPYNVTFPAGVTSMSLNNTVVNDEILESDENFYLNICSSLPDRVAVGDINQTTVTIKDNDGE